jgi:iron complex transport system substrate-binding protein
MLFALLLSCKQKAQMSSGKYVVLSPEVAEIIAALGAADEIVGLTRECSFPPELQEKEIVGDFGAINTEKVLQLSPRMVFSSALEQESIALNLEKLGITVHRSYPKTMSEMLREIEQIGAIIGRENEATALKDSLIYAIENIRQNTQNLKKPKVYLEIYRDPLMSVSDKSFVGELIELAGGDNVFDTLERDYSRVKAEQVIQANPDIMICYSHDTMENILARKGFSRIPAIRTRSIYFEEDINPDLIQRAGPRSIQGIRELARIFEEWRRKAL